MRTPVYAATALVQFDAADEQLPACQRLRVSVFATALQCDVVIVMLSRPCIQFYV